MYAFQSNCKLHTYVHKEILMKRLLISFVPSKKSNDSLCCECIFYAGRQYEYGLKERALDLGPQDQCLLDV